MISSSAIEFPAMPSICSLPTEILLQIFSDEEISTADLFSCARTCQLFNGIASQCKISYNFRVDHPSQSTWKLLQHLQHLIRNPKVGERFRSVNITWHRRRPCKPKTWALRWKWNEEEQQEITCICKKWGISDVTEHIRKGWNSEALVPLLLCFTPKLESLDYGEPVLSMMYPSPTPREGIRIHEYGEGHDYLWEPRNAFDDGWPYFDRCWRSID